MHPIDQDINSGEFHNVYILYGDEAYLRRNYKKKLLKALVSEKDTMNFSTFTVNDVSTEKIIDLAETMPFFAERRVILCEECGYFAKSDEKLADYLKEIPESSIFIFTEESLDKRTKTYKAVKDSALFIECKMPDERTLSLWAINKLKKAGKKITSSAWNEFYLRTSESMDLMDVELDKLISYTGNNVEIKIEDIQAICIGQVEEKIFDMIRAISSKDSAQAMRYYKGLLLSREEPFRILYMLESQFKQLLLVKNMHDKNYSNSEIASAAGMATYFVGKNLEVSRNFSEKEVLSFLSEAASLEGNAKSGLISPQNAVETLIMSHVK
jgi:DNA polymerase III subunit delta